LAVASLVSTIEHSVTIRPFNGSLADAEGLLGVERATFSESPYTAAEVQAMLLEGPQCAWLAVRGDTIAGFAIAFLVTGVHGSWWEMDLLAVHPDWRGHRLGRRLVEAATASGARVARQARAVVADDNGASTQAFLRAGFQGAPGIRNLLIYRPQDRVRRSRTRFAGWVREAVTPEDVADCLANLSALGPEVVAPPNLGAAMGGTKLGGGGLTLLLAEQGDTLGDRRQPAGYAELIEVQTLLYHGAWIESLLASTHAAREALVEHAVNRAREAGLDEVGALVHELNRPLEQALLNAGFRSLGGFRWLVAQLPGG
jgi:ribosomal protein S18 acetylase RimI-like enzyme